MQLRHILLKTPLLVDPIMASLNQGAEFEQVARDHSACPSKVNGGSLGGTSLKDLPASFMDDLQNAQVGQIIGPLESRHGFHLIKVESIS
ncbi:MAG: peptidyl-prolyl cis-trans isomerase C [Bermanella sp.]|jgi:peptidyl-prolyl cis-trans isomerase C